MAKAVTKQSKKCVVCFKIVKKGGFVTADGDVIHGECYTCGMNTCKTPKKSLVGSKTYKVPNANGKMIRICWNCMTKHPQYELLFKNQNSGTNVTTQQTVSTTFKCFGCRKQKKGKSIIPKGTKQKWCPTCWKCPQCKQSLEGKKYGKYMGERWCENCIKKRSNHTGDIVLTKKQQQTKAAAYSKTITKLRGADKGQLRTMNQGIERICFQCKNKIPGAGISIKKEDGTIRIYHKYCLKCDDCGTKVFANQVHVMKGSLLCKDCRSVRVKRNSKNLKKKTFKLK